MKSVLENGGLAQLWSSLPLKFCKNFFKNSSPASRTNPPEQIFKKKFQKNYWFDVVIRLEKSPKMTTTSLKRKATPSEAKFSLSPRIFESLSLSLRFRFWFFKSVAFASLSLSINFFAFFRFFRFRSERILSEFQRKI